MKKLILYALLVAATFLYLPATSYALDAKDSVRCGINEAAGKTGCAGPTKTDTTIGELITNIINVLSLLIGAVAIIMIMIGGFRYVTSAGSDSATASARKTIIYALVGLVVAATAQILVHFVLKNITNS